MEIGQTAEARIAADAAEAMRAAIEETGGREVFFAGELDASGRIVAARVCARGHEGAVPAVIEGLRKGEAVIHNHPSGNIAPSEADLILAASFEREGHGVLIVDNEVSRVYAVIEPLVDEERRLIDVEELASTLAEGGALSRNLQGFEPRPQQGDMLRSVAAAFNEDGIAVIEAPTGVGKTMAYLLPAVKWALDNGERVVVSTRTINLQEQIVYKDMPLIERCLGQSFKTVLVKGRSNYLCLRKFRRAFSEASLFEDDKDQAALASIAEWAEKTEDGTLSDLPFVPPRELWSEICSESDTCRITNCPDPKRCFIGRARRDAAKADVLVVNHHMLFSDLALKRSMGRFTAQGVLPGYRRLVLDEAHNIEDSATSYFGAEATRNGALALVGRFLRQERGHERGLLPFLRAKITKEAVQAPQQDVEEALTLIASDLVPRFAQLRDSLLECFGALRSIAADRCKQIGRDVKWRLTPDVLKDSALRDLHAHTVMPCVEELELCAERCQLLHNKVRALQPSQEEGEPPFLTELLQLEGYRERLVRLSACLAEMTSATLERNTVRWIEIDSKDERIVRAVRCPLDVGEALAEWVYGNLKTVIMTSATLSVRKEFDYFFGRIGLDRVADREVESAALPTPFDYQNQALLCVASDMPEPNSGGFLEESEQAIFDVLEITQGHAFILFTSFYALTHAYNQLENSLRKRSITPLRQGGMTRTRLLDRFRKDEASVLFGTDSFWEGVDVAGRALQCVILPKLPFRVPTEPVLEARAQAIDESGGNSFMEFTVPQAVIKFRQGFGRLIRRKTDRGSIVLLDSRVLRKHYGRVFLESLPDLGVVRGPRDEVLAALSQFHQQKGNQNEC